MRRSPSAWPLHSTAGGRQSQLRGWGQLPSNSKCSPTVAGGASILRFSSTSNLTRRQLPLSKVQGKSPLLDSRSQSSSHSRHSNPPSPLTVIPGLETVRTGATTQRANRQAWPVPDRQLLAGRGSGTQAAPRSHSPQTGRRLPVPGPARAVSTARTRPAGPHRVGRSWLSPAHGTPARSRSNPTFSSIQTGAGPPAPRWSMTSIPWPLTNLVIPSVSVTPPIHPR